jgi:hypothetical protein
MKKIRGSGKPSVGGVRMTTTNASLDRGEVKYMRVKLGVMVAGFVTDRQIPGRLVRSAGMLLGLAAGLLLLTLLTAGKADAAERSPDTGQVQDDAKPGLLGPVTHGVTGVVGGAVETVAPVVQGVAKVTEPVTKPVVKTVATVVAPVAKIAGPVVQPVVSAVEPVVQPVLKPVTRELSPVLTPVLSPVLSTVSDLTAPITQPIVAPLAEATAPVLRPIVRATATEPVVEPVAGATRSTDPGQDTSPLPAPALAGDQQQAVVTTWAPAGQWQTASGGGVARTHVTPDRQAVARGWSDDGQAPGVPWSPPTGPAATGTTGGASTVNHGPGVDGSVGSGGAVLPRPAGGWLAMPGRLVGPSWWISYGRSHPS